MIIDVLMVVAGVVLLFSIAVGIGASLDTASQRTARSEAAAEREQLGIARQAFIEERRKILDERRGLVADRHRLLHPAPRAGCRTCSIISGL